MKKTFLALLAIVSLAACTKMEVEYTPTEEIGFNVVSGKMTKSAVASTTYPEDLNMYVFATTTDNTTGSANYINKGEFTKKGAYNTINTSSTDTKLVWGGTPEAYYWPNVKQLYFAGISKSGNVESLSATGNSPAISMDFSGNGTLTINGYEPGTGTTAEGDNDLMWFSKTEAYGKGTNYVHVDMYHTCSWITVKVLGDDVTGTYTTGTGDSAISHTGWKIDNITINGITTKGDVTLSTNSSTTSGTITHTPGATWTLSTQTADIKKPIVVYDSESGTTFSKTATALENIANNTIVLPQASTNMDITYSYTSPAGATITETANVSLALDKSANATADDNKWKPGYHYTYTVTITASEILIQPDAKTWNDGPNNLGSQI